ncbi:hypothetical protein Y09_2070 [Brachybacterium sp. SW0106-09]|nr:hypothetical protein Y09_2070 [Brachybacterium sp. SW0106-09]
MAARPPPEGLRCPLSLRPPPPRARAPRGGPRATAPCSARR